MNKLVQRALKGTVVLTLALSPLTAQAFASNPEGTTTQAIFQEAASFNLPAPVIAASKIVLTDKNGVTVIDTVSGSRLKAVLRENNYSLNNYRTETGDKAKDLLIVGSEPVFLFKMEYSGASTRLMIPAPTTQVKVNGIPEGTTIVQNEGSEGMGILTTVTSRDLSKDNTVNAKSNASGSTVTTSETLTVVRTPVPRVEIVGTDKEISQTSEYDPVEGECTNGSTVPTTVSADIVALHRAVCIQFPEVYSYGTYRETCPITCDHHDGKAVDIMVSGEEGWLIAQYLTSTAALYDINYLIYEQQIWETDRPYWRPMDDRGSITANHFDHVHVSVNSDGVPYSNPSEEVTHPPHPPVTHPPVKNPDEDKPDKAGPKKDEPKGNKPGEGGKHQGDKNQEVRFNSAS